MNRQDILNMTEMQLKFAVAEHIMGIVINDRVPCGHSGCLSHVTHPCEGCGRWHPNLVPDYPFDMAAAWMVLEVLRNMFFSTKIIMWDHTESVVIICRPRQGHDECLPDLEVEARTLPFAICRATLFAKWSL